MGRPVLVQAVGSWDDERMAGFVQVEELFKGRHFDLEIVVLYVRGYLSFKLSYRDLVAMGTEQGIDLVHTSMLRWVQHYSPEFPRPWKPLRPFCG
jgi:transposase-like protein